MYSIWTQYSNLANIFKISTNIFFRSFLIIPDVKIYFLDAHLINSFDILWVIDKTNSKYLKQLHDRII